MKISQLCENQQDKAGGVSADCLAYPLIRKGSDLRILHRRNWKSSAYCSMERLKRPPVVNSDGRNRKAEAHRVPQVRAPLQGANLGRGLRDPTRMRNHVTNLRQHAHALHGIELHRELAHLRNERIGHELVDLVLPRWAARPQQIGH